MEHVLRYAALACAILAGGMAVAAAHAFVALDVRGAWDDLSGRRRARDLARARAATPTTARHQPDDALREDRVLTRLGAACGAVTMLRAEGEVHPRRPATTEAAELATQLLEHDDTHRQDRQANQTARPKGVSLSGHD